MALGSMAYYDCRQDGARCPPGNRSAYVGTAQIEDIDTAKAILIIGSNPRMEAPVLNARIRKAWSLGAEVAIIGEADVDLTYPTCWVGEGPDAFSGDMADGMRAVMKQAGGGVIIVGQGALARKDGAAVLGHAMALGR